METPEIIPINYSSLYLDVRLGSTILVDDGAMQLKVEAIRNQDVIARVITEEYSPPEGCSGPRGTYLRAVS